MSTVRGDLVGVVYVHAGDGAVRLSAGDTIPDGVEVGEHLIASEGEDADGARKPGRRRSTPRPRSDS